MLLRVILFLSECDLCFYAKFSDFFLFKCSFNAVSS